MSTTKSLSPARLDCPSDGCTCLGIWCTGMAYSMGSHSGGCTLLIYFVTGVAMPRANKVLAMSQMLSSGLWSSRPRSLTACSTARKGHIT